MAVVEGSKSGACVKCGSPYEDVTTQDDIRNKMWRIRPTCICWGPPSLVTWVLCNEVAYEQNPITGVFQEVKRVGGTYGSTALH
jgi:hypothetical protein